MNKKILFAALFLAALSIGFIACDNDDDPRLDNDDDNTENVVDDDSTDIDSDSIDNVEGEDDYYNCDTTEMVCTGKAYDITTTTAKVAATVHIPFTLLAQCKLGVQVSSSKEDLIAHENVTNFTTKDLTGNDFVVNLKNLKSSTTYYYCAYIYLNGIYHYGLIREFKTWCVLTTSLGFRTYSGGSAWNYDHDDCIVDGSGDYAPGSKVTLSVTLGVDWYFDFWSDCGSKELKHTITITSDTTITANFKRKPCLSLSNNTNFGDLTGGGCYDVGTEVTITAKSRNEEFCFSSWRDGNTENPRTVVVNSDTTFHAIFKDKARLRVELNYFCYGTITATSTSKDYYEDTSFNDMGVYDYFVRPGEDVTITVIPNEGYDFIRWNDGNIENSRTITINEDVTYIASIANGTENGYEWVDLGLPSGLKWATCNVGATTSGKFGNYYAWGETTPKSTYSWSTYKWCNGSSTTMTKYCTDSDYGTVDNKTVLDLEDDAAAVNMGGSWRMPTKEEFEELLDECTISWDGHNFERCGFKVTGPNGNSILLPLAAHYSDNYYQESTVYDPYWSSSLNTVRLDAVHSLKLYYSSGNVYLNYIERFLGLPVRGVCP